MHLKLEKNEKTLEFWRAMIVVADDQLNKLRADPSQRLATGVSDDVKRDVDRVLSGKTYAQLTVLQEGIVKKLQSNNPVDVDYWENLLKELVVYKAKAKLNDMHQELLSKRLEQLRKRQQEEAQKVQEELRKVLYEQEEVQVHGQGVGPGEGIQTEPVDQTMMEQQDAAFEKEAQAAEDTAVQTYERSMSPEPLSQLGRDDRDAPIIDPMDDLRELVCINHDN